MRRNVVITKANPPSVVVDATAELLGVQRATGVGSVGVVGASWNLPATINIPQSGNLGLRQYAVNAGAHTISVSGLPAGVTYNAGTESLVGASTGTGSATVTFTLSLSGQPNVQDTATVELVALPDGLPDYYSESLVPATLWVNGSTGSDSNTRAQVLAGGGSVQWATIGRAAWGSSSYSSQNASEAAQAGDVVQVAGGVYWEGTGGPTATNNRFDVILNPANSGTEAAPIIFRSSAADPAEIRVIQNVRGPIIGANGRSWIYWHGFRVNDYYCGSVSDTGPVLCGGESVNTFDCRVTGCNISGHDGSYYWGYSTFHSNYRLTSSHRGVRVAIADNKIWRAKRDAGNGDQNEAGVLTYGADSCVFEHNLVVDCGQGIFLKGQLGETYQQDNVVRFNRVDGCHYGGIRNLAGVRSRIYQNLVAGMTGGEGVRLGWSSVSTNRANDAVVVNNTVVDCAGAGLNYSSEPGIGQGFFNNVVAHVGGAAYRDFSHGTPAAAQFDSNRNLFFATSGDLVWASEGGTNLGFSAWQDAGKDIDGMFSDPLFEDRNNGDYRLAFGSPALTLGRDYLNLMGGGTDATIAAGCFITGDEVIGPRIALPGD